MEQLAALPRNLEKAGVILRPLSLELPSDLSYDHCLRLGGFLGSLNRDTRWWIGDLLLFGEATFAEKFSQLETATGLTKGTLLSYMRLCARVAPVRRKVGLGLSVHMAVMNLMPREQRRWLALAEREGLNAAALRARIQDEVALANGSLPGVTVEPRGGDFHVESPPGLPQSYAVPGPILRRLVREAVPAKNGYVLVPSELVERVASIIEV